MSTQQGSLSLRQIGRVFSLRSKGALGDDSVVSFHDAIFQFLSAVDLNKAELSRSPIAAFGVNKIDIVMHDILMRDDFLDEPQCDIDRFLFDTTKLLSILRFDSETDDAKEGLERICQRVPEVVQHLWDNRDRLHLWNPEVKTIRLDPICRLLLGYHASAGDTSRILSQFLTYLWVFAPYPRAELGELLHLHTNHTITCQYRTNSEVEIAHKTYLHAAIVEAIGPDPFILRVNEELQRPGVSDEHLAACLSVVHDYKRLPEFRPFIIKHKVMDVMLETLERYRTADDRRFRVVVYSHVSAFLRWCTAIYTNILSLGTLNSGFVVPGEHVLTYIARGVELAVDDSVNFTEYGDKLLDDIRFYGLFSIKASATHSDASSRQFLAGLHAGARDVWWPCLTRLQIAHYRTKGDTLIAALVGRWTELGTALGLDEAKERKRHRKEERVFCSWPNCQFNTHRPPGKLSTCQGCGETQYCGKNCQKSDWSQGGHKKRCGTRIKK